MGDASLKIKISYTDDNDEVWSKEIGVNLMAYSDALNTMINEGFSGQAAQTLINATMAYGAALQTMDSTDESGNVISGSVDILNQFNSFWRDEAKNVGLSDTDVKSPSYSQNATVFENSEGQSVEIAKFAGANVAMGKTYALLYAYEITLPEGATLTDLRLILTDDAAALDRTTQWDRKTGTSYTETTKEPGTTSDGTAKEYDVLWVKDVPASEMTTRYATIYVEYTMEQNGETQVCYAYSKTMHYGVITYLNAQIDKMLNKDGFVLSEADDSDLKYLYLWDNLRTVATYAEK